MDLSAMFLLYYFIYVHVCLLLFLICPNPSISVPLHVLINWSTQRQIQLARTQQKGYSERALVSHHTLSFVVSHEQLVVITSFE